MQRLSGGGLRRLDQLGNRGDPLSAAARVCTAFEIESESAPRSDALLRNERAVKKLVGLSSAELTRKPVESRSCAELNFVAVPCRLSRLDLTALERVISDKARTLLGC